MAQRPKLRTVEKYNPPYLLNKFPQTFPVKLAKEIVYLLATRKSARLEGSDWEEIFAKIINAKWEPSNVGLDDVVQEQTAWGAKTVKNNNPFTAQKVRLISGRNSPVYSYGDTEVSKCDPSELGRKVLEIWNERVAGVRKLYQHVRTVVLIKSNDLLELVAFEFDTTIYSLAEFWWQWNDRNNLEGFRLGTDEHVFTWQPHGSQFTIIEKVPEDSLAMRIRKPPSVDQDQILRNLNFDDSWVEIVRK